jgi:hypothetical protein
MMGLFASNVEGISAREGCVPVLRVASGSRWPMSPVRSWFGAVIGCMK